MTTITVDLLAHATGCPADRIDVTRHEPAFDNDLDQPVTVLHCIDCTAHEGFYDDGSKRDAPKHIGPLAGLLPTTDHAEPIDHRIRPYYSIGGN